MDGQNTRRSTKPLKDIYYRYIKRNFKWLPLVGIILLIIISAQKENIEGAKTNTTMKAMLKDTLTGIKSSLIIKDKLTIYFDIILIITIILIFKYWLMRFRVVRRNKGITEWLIFSIIIIIFGKYISVSSPIAKYYDYLLSFILYGLVIVGTYWLAKIIDGIDLMSDLYCWGLRLVGAIVIIIGAFITASGTIGLMFIQSNLLISKLPLVLGLCILGLGAFMQYRSFRRHGVFVYHREF